MYKYFMSGQGSIHPFYPILSHALLPSPVLSSSRSQIPRSSLGLASLSLIRVSTPGPGPSTASLTMLKFVTLTIEVHLQVSRFKYAHIMAIFQVRNEICVEKGLGLGLGIADDHINTPKHCGI